MNFASIVAGVLWTWVPIVFLGISVGWYLGFRTAWATKKYIDIRVQRKAGGLRTPDQYEVEVDDRKYLVNCIEEIPEPDRTLVRRKSISSIEWEQHFLRIDGSQFVTECRICKKKWYPHQNHDFKGCTGFIKVIGQKADSWHPADGEIDTLTEFPKVERSIEFPEEFLAPGSGVVRAK